MSHYRRVRVARRGIESAWVHLKAAEKNLQAARDCVDCHDKGATDKFLETAVMYRVQLEALASKIDEYLGPEHKGLRLL